MDIDQEIEHLKFLAQRFQFLKKFGNNDDSYENLQNNVYNLLEDTKELYDKGRFESEKKDYSDPECHRMSNNKESIYDELEKAVNNLMETGLFSSQEFPPDEKQAIEKIYNVMNKL